MFSIAGGPYEELDIYESKQEALNAIDEEALSWTCCTHGFAKEVENNANNDDDPS